MGAVIQTQQVPWFSEQVPLPIEPPTEPHPEIFKNRGIQLKAPSQIFSWAGNGGEDEPSPQLHLSKRDEVDGPASFWWY